MIVEQDLTALEDDLVATLRTMSKANGYNYDYGEVTNNAFPDGFAVDPERPRVFVRWVGPVPGSWETATSRFRRIERYEIAVVCVDYETPKRTSRMMQRVERDIIAALFADRRRGSTRTQTEHLATDAEYASEGGVPDGGMVTVTIGVRHDYRSGAMESAA